GGYGAEYIDMLCLSGRVVWGRLTAMESAGKAPLKSSPIALMLRDHASLWKGMDWSGGEALTSEARAVRDALHARGALFFHELVAATGLLRTHVERALGELAGAGPVTPGSFRGLRGPLPPSRERRNLSGRASSRRSAYGVDTAGRWALLSRDEERIETGEGGVPAGANANDEKTAAIARTLLKRYGVVFRSLLARESLLPTWRELAAVY